MAPEVIKGEHYSFGVDWWGLGCILYEMIEGHSPFRKHKEKVKRDEVERRIKELKEGYSKKFTHEIKDLCEKVMISKALI